MTDPNNPQDQGQSTNNPQGQGPNYTPPNRGKSAPPGSRLAENDLALERRYGLSISDEDRKKSFEIEDERWSTKNQVKDWLKLGGMVLLTAIWCLIVYFLEPGLR